MTRERPLGWGCPGRREPLDTSVGYRTKGAYASPLKWSPGEQKPQGCVRHQRRSKSFPWPQTACGPEGLAVDEALNRLTRAPWALGQGQRKASLGLRKFKETRRDRELGQRSLANSCPSGTCGLTAGILWNKDATGVPSGTDSAWRTGTSLRYVLG